MEATAPAPETHGGHDPHDHGHGNPHLAHHFDTMEQQYDSGKLGMWVFLATELLMFGGLFCAYSVYRANHPEVFLYAHHYLSTMWGAINTAVLLASSLTMAWAVRAAQLNQKGLMIGLCLTTLLGGFGFMVIKAYEYNHKFEEYLGPGFANAYNVDYQGPDAKNNEEGLKEFENELKAKAPPPLPPHGIAASPAVPYLYMDPHHGTSDAALITPHMNSGGELAEPQLIATQAIPSARNAQVDVNPARTDVSRHEGRIEFVDLDQQLSRQRVNTFFGIYYCMTGLHGVHVLIGMGLIFWITFRAGSTRSKAWILPLIPAGIGVYFVYLWWLGFVIPTPTGIIHAATFLLWAGIVLLVLASLWALLRITLAARHPLVEGEFNETYFAPVDLVGLYWHLVDLIWIFLFPLLYLIHGQVGS